MNCPECNLDLQCPCTNCVSYFGTDRDCWIDTKEEVTPVGKTEKVSIEVMKCPKCGYFNTPDGWLDIEWEQREKRLAQTEREE